MHFSVSFCTLGCRVNQYESRALEERFCKRGFIVKKFNEICDVYVVNTCAVTVESERKSRQMIHRARALAPAAVVCAAGCSSQISAQSVAEAGADIVIGTSDKMKIVRLAEEMLAMPLEKREKIIDVSVSGEPECDNYVVRSSERARAFVKIEDGCDGKCTYCTIAKARGDVRCKHPEIVIDEITSLAKSGVREVTLTGIELSAYRYGLASLIEKVNAIDGIERIRLGSLDPTVLSEDFCCTLAKCKKVQPHFHISLQSGCTKTLLSMKRRYTAEKAFENLERLRSYIPRLKLSCDLIVGFPGETDADFEETLAFMKKVKFLHAHIFPYSKRPGTIAADMQGQVAGNVKTARLKRVEELQAGIKAHILDEALNENTLTVLFESRKSGILRGHTDNFIEVEAPGEKSFIGACAEVVPVSHDGDIITGDIRV